MEGGLADVGLSYGYTPDAFKTACEINLFRFCAGKNLLEIQRLNEAFRASDGWEDFLGRAKLISEKFNEAWLRSEYNTAYMVAENSAAYYRMMKQNKIFPTWEYVTIDDDLVRPEHRDLHGIRLPYNDKKWRLIFPPNGWRCRCRVRPLTIKLTLAEIKENSAKVDGFFDTSEWAKAKAQGWGVNRALTAEVFTANQQYVRKFPRMAASKLDSLIWSKWGLESVSKIMASVSDKTPVTNDVAAEIWEKESEAGKIKIELYNGRTAVLDKSGFDRHTIEKGRDDRSKYWNAMKQTVKEPDEIWLNKYSSTFNDVCLVKFYNDNTIVANYRIENKGLVLKTWHKLALTKRVINKTRSGLLIKKRAK